MASGGTDMADRRRAWARALFGSTTVPERRRSWGEALDALALAFAEERRIGDFLGDPGVSQADKASLLSSALTVPDEVFSRFCSLLVEKDRAYLLPEIALIYRADLDKAEGTVRLEVEAARSVDHAILERIGAAWARMSGTTRAETRLRLNPGLIAGYRLRSGSVRIDYSVAGRLERLRRDLSAPMGRSPQGKES